jgi:hypothetical protein
MIVCKVGVPRPDDPARVQPAEQFHENEGRGDIAPGEPDRGGHGGPVIGPDPETVFGEAYDFAPLRVPLIGGHRTRFRGRAGKVMPCQPRHVAQGNGVRGKIKKRLFCLEVSKLQHENDPGGAASALLGCDPFRRCEGEIFRALEIIEIRQGVESMPLLGRQHSEPPGASRPGGRVGARTGPRRRCPYIPEIVHFRVCMPARMAVPWG